jgi:hypothetical protein
MKRAIIYTQNYYPLGLMVSVTIGCERSLSDEVAFATFPKQLKFY